MKDLFAILIIVILIQACAGKTNKVEDELLFGISETSHLKDYIDIPKNDSCYISWCFFNDVGFGGLTVYSIDSTCNNLKFFAINKNIRNIVVYHDSGEFYVYKLVKRIPLDSARVLVD